MNYPLISEYIESILSAEDNFAELKNLRPVLDDRNNPVMSSGNFAVVFKMKDISDGKYYAVKCFTREQEGRNKSYCAISDYLKDVKSPYLVSAKYLEKELFVDTKMGAATEFPVLVMDWVDGVALDKYLRDNIDNNFVLNALAHCFGDMAKWLIKQPFAHGDLKPDNIIVNNGLLTLVDYDGMFVPSMMGQNAREVGSPDFQNPNRKVYDFDRHIDDLALVSILLSLKALQYEPSLLEKFDDSDRLLFSKNDYLNIMASPILNHILHFPWKLQCVDLCNLMIKVLIGGVISEEEKEKMGVYLKLVKSKEDYELLKAIADGMKEDYEARARYGYCLMEGNFCANDLFRGINFVYDGVLLDNVIAQYVMGECYLKGVGVEQNYSKALEFYFKSSEQGNADAMNELGICFYNGIGVEKNYKKAFELFSKAVEQDSVDALYYLGECYYHGHGVVKNYSKAVKSYLESAEKGNSNAQYSIGYCYEVGQGVEKDSKKSYEWYLKAAEQGNDNAWFSIGGLDDSHKITRADYLYAKELYLNAIKDRK